MRFPLPLIVAIFMPASCPASAAETRPVVVLEGSKAKLTIDLGGGSIANFHLTDNPLNPFSWDSWDFSANPTGEPPMQPRSMGHFLCLDRWGPATEAEQAHGMGWHGEASQEWWALTQNPTTDNGAITAIMRARLPLAGLTAERTVRLASNGSTFIVTESVFNTHHLGRIYNIVQHPTIGRPFLDEDTIVDCNGTRGFMQETPMPHPENPEVRWPDALKKDGTKTNLRFLHDDATPAVASYIIEGEFGWITAINPSKRLLIGYLWRAAEYPWIDMWRSVRDGKPFARGLEFGTTGLHQPGPALVAKGKIFDRQLFRFIDSGETQRFSYACFLAEIPEDFAGVAEVRYAEGIATIIERADGRRMLPSMDVGLLP